MGLIQFDKLEEVIKDVEKVYEKHSLGQEDVHLLIRQMQIRLNNQQQEQKIADVQNNLNMKDIMSGFMNRKD